jgi:hypothetical protein
MKIKKLINKIKSFCYSEETVLHCYTFLPHAHKYANIDYAINYAPSWWRETPAQLSNPTSNTIKSCVAVLDYFKKGIVIPSWFEMDVTVNSKSNPEWYKWVGSSPDLDTNNSHKPEQFAGFAGENGKNIKITSPWKFKTDEEIYFTWTQPTWHLRNILSNIVVMPGVINFKFQHATEINLLVINKDKTEEFTISPRTPLAILHPLTSKKIKIETHLISKEEWDNMLGPQGLILKRNSTDLTYKKRKHLVKTSEEGTCPFKRYE